jgi:hypothetical protein
MTHPDPRPNARLNDKVGQGVIRAGSLLWQRGSLVEFLEVP